MAVQTGIEPAISCVTGRHVNRYTTGPFGCGDRTWTCDLRVMSPTSYQLLHPAMLYLNLIWRRKRDSNPRDAFTPCRFSRPIPSAGLGYSSILSIFSLVAEEGLEPPTSRVWTVRSSQLSYSAIYCYLLIFNWWRLGGSNPWPPACKAGALPAELSPHGYLINGREDRIRTCDPLVPNQVLYQAEPLPEFYGAPTRTRT